MIVDQLSAFITEIRKDIDPNITELHSWVLDTIYDWIDELRNTELSTIRDDKFEAVIEPALKHIACIDLAASLLKTGEGWRQVLDQAVTRAEQERSWS